jgi:undecaprenyl-diphosphatase
MNDILLGDLGKELIILLQSLSPLLDIPFRIISFLGNEIVFVTILGGIFWGFSKKLGVKLFYLMIFSGIINIFLKGLFGLPRPYQTFPNEIAEISSASGYSFPSGHAMASSTFYGYVASLHKSNYLIIGISSLIIILISTSRMYLGVHYFSDILLGIILGLLLIYVFIKSYPSLEKFFKKQSDFMVLTFVLLISFTLMLISALTTVTFGNELDEASNGGLTGLLAGGTIGLLMERRYIRFSTENISTGAKIVRLFFGYFILLTIYILGDSLTTNVTGNFILVTDYFRYFVLGIGAIFIVPYVFNKFENIPNNEN